MLVMLTTALSKIPRSEPFYADLYLQSPPQAQCKLHLGGLAVRLAICSQTYNGACLGHPHCNFSSASCSPSFPDLHVSLPCMQESRWQSYFLFRGSLLD